MLRDRLRERLHFVPAGLLRQWHDDMQALAAARLAERHESQFFEQRTGQLGGVDHAVPAERWIGVEVEHHAIGLLDARSERIPGVQFDGAYLRGADERLHAVDRNQRWMARVQIGMLRDIRNGQLLAMLLKKQLAADVLRRSHERYGPVL